MKTITVDKGDEVKEGALLADIEVPELLADFPIKQHELAKQALDFLINDQVLVTENFKLRRAE